VSIQLALQELEQTVFIDGKYQRSTGRPFDILDPATEEIVGQGVNASLEEIESAIAIANRVQPSWWQLSALERAERLHEVATKMRELRPTLAELMTREMGKPYKESVDEVNWSATAIDYYAEVARHQAGNVLGPATAGQLHFSLKEPLGVTVSILPFNYPLVLLAWQAGAALATGNAVIVKPSELTTLTTLLFMQAFEVLPPGLMQCLPGGRGVGELLVNSPDTHMIAFTGRVEAGQAIARSCGEQFKRCLIEASGNDPFIVMPSAPIDIAARGAAFAAFLNCGQVCTSAERFYVHRDIYDDFVEQLISLTKALRIGNGLDCVDIGPMATRAGRDRFAATLQRAIAQGAQVACGGSQPAQFQKGWFMEPTVLIDITPDMDIVNEEPFGPVAPIVKVNSFEEAIALANRSQYGLGATVYTNDLSESMRAVQEIQAGMVWINAPLLDNDAGAFGGRKMSGMGRQLGAEGLEIYQHTKLVMIDPQANAHDFWWFPYSDAESYPRQGKSSS
jgi:acyl-CoA reductase-like NAD-dependent aldehyde dehydrogenase